MNRHLIVNIRVLAEEKKKWLDEAIKNGFTGISPFVRWLINNFMKGGK